MNMMTLSTIMKMKPSLGIRHQQAGVWAAVVVLLASTLASAQTSSTSQPPQPPVPKTETVTPASTAGIPIGFVDGASNCARTGDKDCSSGRGPFRKVSEGARLNYKDGDVEPVSPGGTLFVRAGSYTEPIVLNKPLEIRNPDAAIPGERGWGSNEEWLRTRRS